MAEAVKDRNTARNDGEILTLGIAAALIILGGVMVAKNAAGNAAKAADAAGLVVVGVSENSADNSAGAAGDIDVRVHRKRAFWFDNDGTNPVTIAHLFTDVYVKDDQTVDSNGGVNSIVAGKCLAVDATMGVLVEFN